MVIVHVHTYSADSLLYFHVKHTHSAFDTKHTLQLVVELAAGASVAASMSAKMKTLDPSLKKVGVILCGGNIDLDHLPW